ncbi:MAG: hypothetical protein DWQ20_00725 [Actinobacteria bacterium]|nr:MAG: hypothetical protein DWQ20_00725 [Actinomycetota bacterium]
MTEPLSRMVLCTVEAAPDSPDIHDNLRYDLVVNDGDAAERHVLVRSYWRSWPPDMVLQPVAQGSVWPAGIVGSDIYPFIPHVPILEECP